MNLEAMHKPCENVYKLPNQTQFLWPVLAD